MEVERDAEQVGDTVGAVIVDIPDAELPFIRIEVGRLHIAGFDLAAEDPGDHDHRLAVLGFELEDAHAAVLLAEVTDIAGLAERTAVAGLHLLLERGAHRLLLFTPFPAAERRETVECGEARLHGEADDFLRVIAPEHVLLYLIGDQHLEVDALHSHIIRPPWAVTPLSFLVLQAVFNEGQRRIVVLEKHPPGSVQIPFIKLLLDHVIDGIIAGIDVLRQAVARFPVVIDAAAVEGGRAHVLRVPVVIDLRDVLVVTEGVCGDAGHFEFLAADDQGPGDVDGAGITAARTEFQFQAVHILVAVAVHIGHEAGVGIQGAGRRGLRLRRKGSRGEQRQAGEKQSLNHNHTYCRRHPPAARRGRGCRS